MDTSSMASLAQGIFALAVVLSGTWHGQVSAATNASAVARPASSTNRLVVGQAGYKYIALLPNAPARGPKRFPLIIFLHGACPNEDLTKFRHFSPMKYGLDHPGFPFMVACPATSRGWAVPTLNHFLRHLQTTYPIDPDRIYLTGHSMGGHATWAWALAAPTRFAAIAPAAGGGNVQEAERTLQLLPVWIFHGVKDTVVPVAYGQAMAEALKPGGNVKTTFYPDLGHDTWDPPYRSAELYDWFLEHRREKGAPAGRAPTQKPLLTR